MTSKRNNEVSNNYMKLLHYYYYNDITSICGIFTRIKNYSKLNNAWNNCGPIKILHMYVY